MQAKKRPKVMIGMSGGLDSSVCAALLKEQGYDCVGVYLNLWADPTEFSEEESQNFPTNKCCSIESLLLARRICQKLEIPFYSINLEETFKEKVVEFFLDGFRAGETPNPCVRCNKTIKFGAFFDKMKELGCDYLATGHYARLEKDSEGVVHLHQGEDSSKDQSYFLYHLNQERLRHLLFPIGHLNKTKVRELAHGFGLVEVEKKRESQGVCFYPEKDPLPFLERYLQKDKDYQEGAIVNQEAKEIGRHKGLPFYTIGQRKGIGIGGGPALFVQGVDRIRNVVIVGSDEDLYSHKVALREVSFLADREPDLSQSYDMKIRSHGKMGKGRLVRKEDGTYEAHFDEPQKAVMPGQALVLYNRGELIGGGLMSA